MLRHDWNALRHGDHVLVHHSMDDEVHLVAGVVTAVTADDGGNHIISVRVATHRGQQVVHPRRLSVHHDPIEFDGHCWRCAALAPPTTATPKRRLA